jgi:PAS domain S-box-containing protein
MGKRKPLYILLSTLLMIFVLPIAVSIFIKNNYPEIAAVSFSVHTFMETFAAFIALMVSLYYLYIRPEMVGTKYKPRNAYLGSGFMIVFIFSVIHACIEPGNNFVLSLVLLNLLSSIVFAHIVTRGKYNKYTTFSVMSGIFILLGILILSVNKINIKVIDSNGFTNISKILNFITGTIYILPIVYFMIQYKKEPSKESFVLASFFTFNSSAAFLFSYSQLWNYEWWLWHVLRFAAFAILFFHICYIFIEGIKSVHKNSIRLKEVSYELETIIDSFPGLIFYKDTKNSFIRVNKHMADVSKMTKKEMAGRSCFELYSKEIAQSYWDDDLEVIKSKKARINIEERFEANGVTSWVLTSKIPFYSIDREIIGVIGISTDITRRKEAEQMIKNYMHELRISNKELDDFAYIASHDLKEPLRTIAAYSKFLLEDYSENLDDEGKRMLNVLVNATDRMRLLIEALLRYSRLGREKLRKEITDIKGLIEEIKEDIEIEIKEHNVEIIIETEIPEIETDRTLIKEVFLNLINNGIKYNESEKKTISVGYRYIKENDVNAFYVKDNGIGIEKKHEDKVFSIFKRLHARDKYGGGIGAGLTIARKIIIAHEGDIWFDSEPDEYTIFYFTVGGNEDVKK